MVEIIERLILVVLYFFFVMMYLLRAMFILKFGWFGTDTLYFLMIAKKIRKSKRIPNEIEEIAIENDYTLPVLFPALLALFNPKYHKKMQLIGPALELVIGFILLYFTYYLTDSIFIASIAAVIYLISPISFYQSVNLNYRGFANLLMSLSLVSLFIFFNNNEIIYLALSIIFTTLVFLSHKLTTQNMIFILILLSIVFLTPLPIFIILAAFGFATIFSNGFFIKQINDHFKFQMHFFKHGNPISGIKFHNPIQVAYWFPFVLLLPFVIFTIPLNFTTLFFLVWFLSMLLMTIFWLWGCEIHHLTYAVFPFAVLVSIYFTYNNLIFGFDIIELVPYLLLTISFICLVFFFIVYFKTKNVLGKYWYKLRSYSLNDQHLKAFEFAKKNLDKKGILFSIPARYNYALMYFTGMKILSGQASSKNIKKTTLELPLFDWNNRDLSEKIHIKVPFRYLFLDMDYLNRTSIKALVNHRAIKIVYSDEPIYIAEIIDEHRFRAELIRLPEIQQIKLRCITSAKDKVMKS